jgi:putative salt-induced outer membrane protein YdiY
MLRWASAILLVLGVCVSIHADVVIFKNGDKLTGKVVKLEGGKLTFKADVVGEVPLDLANISSFSTEDPAEFHLQDGTVLKSKVHPAEPGQVTLEKTELIQAQTIPLTAVTSINPPIKPPVTWSGSVTLGMTSTHGNTFTESANVSANVTRRTEQDRLRAYSTYLASRTRDDDTNEKVTTEESFTLGGKYDYFLTKKWYTFLNADYKKDHVADLDYRIIAGGGMGYQWIEEDNLKFSTDAGVSELCEKYTKRKSVPPALRPPRWEEEITKSDELSLQLGYALEWIINDKFSFYHNTRYYPSFGDPADYFLTTDAELRAAITKNLFGSLKAIMDYDSTPGEDVGTTDTKYILGVGWKF